MKGKNAKTDRPPNTNPKSKLDYTQISNKNSVTHLLSQDNTNGEELHYKTVSNSTHVFNLF